jgi:hypothetical protein
MEGRVGMRVDGNTKIINLAQYKRKRLFKRNKFWFITIGMVVFMAGSTIYFKDSIMQFLNYESMYQQIGSMPTPQ